MDTKFRKIKTMKELTDHIAQYMAEVADKTNGGNSRFYEPLIARIAPDADPDVFREFQAAVRANLLDGVMMKSVSIRWDELPPEGSKKYGHQWKSENIAIAETDLTREFPAERVPREVIKRMRIKGDISFDAELPYFLLPKTNFLRLNGDPLLIVRLSQRPAPWDMDDEQAMERWMMSKKGVVKDIVVDGVPYEFLGYSAAGFREKRFFYVRKDFDVESLPKLKTVRERMQDPELARVVDESFHAKRMAAGYAGEPETYLSVFDRMTMPEQLLDVVGHGAYAILWRTMQVIGKQGARQLGLHSSASKQLAWDWKVSPPIDVVCEFDEGLKESYRTWFVDTEGHTQDMVDAFLEQAERMWKPNTADGQFWIASDAAVGAFHAMGWKISEDELIGRSLQGRIRCEFKKKGTGLITPRDKFDGFWYDDGTPEGCYPFRGYDVIAEKASCKTPCLGLLYPTTMALLSLSDPEGSRYSDYQFLNALFPTPAEWEAVCDEMTSVEREDFMLCCTDPYVGMAKNGMLIHDASDDAVLEGGGAFVRSHVMSALAANTDVLRDFYNLTGQLHQRWGSVDKTSRGKVRHDANRCRLQIDPTCAFSDIVRKQPDGTLQMVWNSSNRQRLMLPEPRMVYFNGEERLALLARNPLNHPGEIPIVQAMGSEYLDRSDLHRWFKEGPHPLDLSKTRGIIWLSAMDAVLLMQMGGADVDGDIAQFARSEKLLRIRWARPVLPFLVELESNPSAKQPMDMAAMRRYVASSLLYEGIGTFTHNNTTALELIHILEWKLAKGDAGRLRTEPRESKGEYITDSIPGMLIKMGRWCRQALEGRGASMPEWERPHMEGVATLADAKPWKPGDLAAMTEFASIAIPALFHVSAMERYKQELAINVAKTGEWPLDMRTGTETIDGVEIDAYAPHGHYDGLNLWLKPHWLRPEAKRRVRHAGSNIQQLADKALAVYREMESWIKRVGNPVPCLMIDPASIPEIWTQVQGVLRGGYPGVAHGYLKSTYRQTNRYRFWTEKDRLRPEDVAGVKDLAHMPSNDAHNAWLASLGREESSRLRREAFASIAFITRDFLFRIMDEHPGQEAEVIMAAYRAAVEVDHERTDNARSACGFAWSSIGDEIARLLYAIASAQGGAHERVVPVYLNRRMDLAPKPGNVVVEQETLPNGRTIRYVKEIEPDGVEIYIGTANVPDGQYELFVYNEKPYLKVLTAGETGPAPAPRITKMPFRVTGLSAYAVDGVRLDELIKSAGSRYLRPLSARQTVMSFRKDTFTVGDKTYPDEIAAILDGTIIGHVVPEARPYLGPIRDDEPFLVEYTGMSPTGKAVGFRILQEIDPKHLQR